MRSSIALNVAGSNTLSAASMAQAFIHTDEWLIWLAIGFHVDVNNYFFNTRQCKRPLSVLILNVQICILHCTLLYCTCMTSIDFATWSSCLWFHKQYHEFFHCPQDLWTIRNQAPSLLGGFLRAHKPNEFGDRWEYLLEITWHIRNELVPILKGGNLRQRTITIGRAPPVRYKQY